MNTNRIHIHSGHAAAQTLAAAGLPPEDRNEVWADVLHVGALDCRWTDPVRHAVRAHVLAGPEHAPAAVEKFICKQDEMLDAITPADAVVIWVDACMYDQLILAFILDRLASRHPLQQRAAPLELICETSAPGVVPFHGYGELQPAQVLSLLPLRRPITDAQIEAARLAWRTAASPDRSPVRLRAIARQVGALPFMPLALERLADELLDADGLSLTDRRILETLRGNGRMTKSQLFVGASKLEPIPFMGDSTFFDRVDRLVELGLIKFDVKSAEYFSVD